MHRRATMALRRAPSPGQSARCFRERSHAPCGPPDVAALLRGGACRPLASVCRGHLEKNVSVDLLGSRVLSQGRFAHRQASVLSMGFGAGSCRNEQIRPGEEEMTCERIARIRHSGGVLPRPGLGVDRPAHPGAVGELMVDGIRRLSQDHWVAHVQGISCSEVKIEVHLSRENARLTAGIKGVGQAVLALFDGSLSAARLESGPHE